MAAIIEDPVLLAETRAVLPTLKAIAETKAGNDGVRRVIAKRFELYPQPQRTDEQWAAWWADYYDVLADLSLASLEAGMRAYVADPSSEFMPKPGKLRELAFSAPCRSIGRYYRAKRAIMMADEPPAPMVAPEVAEKNAQEIRSLLAGFNEAVEAKSVSHKRQLPSIAGKVDAGGITPEMRELLARQRSNA